MIEVGNWYARFFRNLLVWAGGECLKRVTMNRWHPPS